MHEHPELPDALTVHIRAAGRPDIESERLGRLLVAACWPGGIADRCEPIARGWLRTWFPPAPTRLVVDVPQCGCARGRCRICN